MRKNAMKIQSDPRPDLLIERGPHNRGVGRWVPEENIGCFATICEQADLLGRSGRIESLLIHFVGPVEFRSKGRVKRETAVQFWLGDNLLTRHHSRKCL